ncbi:hypothetical protein BD560DRAFT_432650 [Blakeslea trispora]|nr:hypothetical protein BD560DRAFT_432650 [Blakeslea trispora]
MSIDDKWEFDMPKFWDFTNSIPQKRPNESQKNISGPSFPVQNKPKNKPNTQPQKTTNQSVFDRLASENTVASTSKLAQHKPTSDKAEKPPRLKTTSDYTSHTHPLSGRKRLREGNRAAHHSSTTGGLEKEDSRLEDSNKRFKTQHANAPSTLSLGSKEQGKARPRKILKRTVNTTETSASSDNNDSTLDLSTRHIGEEERKRLLEITLARAILARENLWQSVKKAKEKEQQEQSL